MNDQYDLIKNTPDNVLKELEQAFWDIPFENSAFQTEAFVIAAQVTPERAYRSIGLQMYSKLTALKAGLVQRQLQEIRIDEINYLIEQPECTVFDRRRLIIERDGILDSFTWADKLRDDAIVELELLYSHFRKFPKYTRQQFESAEKNHFEQLMHRKINGIEGPTEALINMADDFQALGNFESALALLPPGDVDAKTLQDIQAAAMTNKIKIHEKANK